MTEHVKETPSADYTAVIKRDGEWWIGWIEEIPGVNCQEETREELIVSLKLALGDALAFNRSEALEAAGSDYAEVKIAL
jgi:predicted RNase H-like HicB family nuclease